MLDPLQSFTVDETDLIPLREAFLPQPVREDPRPAELPRKLMLVAEGGSFLGDRRLEVGDW